MATINENQHSNSKGIRKLESGNYEIGTLLFKVKMLLEDEDHFISKETTINIFWEDTKNATKKSDLNDCFNTCISRLRKVLSKDKDIKLLCKTKKGYQLIVNNNPPEKENE